MVRVGRSHLIPGPTPEDEPLGLTLGGSWQAVGGGSFADATGYGWFGGAGDVPGEMTLLLERDIVVGAPAE